MKTPRQARSRPRSRPRKRTTRTSRRIGKLLLAWADAQGFLPGMTVIIDGAPVFALITPTLSTTSILRFPNLLPSRCLEHLQVMRAGRKLCRGFGSVAAEPGQRHDPPVDIWSRTAQRWRSRRRLNRESTRRAPSRSEDSSRPRFLPAGRAGNGNAGASRRSVH